MSKEISSGHAVPEASPSWHQRVNASFKRRQGRQSVLIADDDQDSRESLGELLELSGHSVQYARDGQEALSLALVSHPDVIFLDIQMPGMSGYSVCHELRSSQGFESTRIYALSGLRGPDHERRCAQEKFDARLSKPLDPNELTHLL